MKIYNHKKRTLWAGTSLLGMLFIGVGIFSLVLPYIVELEGGNHSLYVTWGFLVFGIMVVSAYSGTLIDIENKRVRAYSSFLGFKFGKWTELPEISYIQLISDTYQSINEPNGISPTLSGIQTDYTALFYNQSDQVVIEMVFTKEEKAIRETQLLSSQLNARLDFLVAR